MGYEVKLNSTLRFKEEEAGIANMVKSLTQKQKMTETINGLVREYYYHPEKFTDFSDVKQASSNQKEYLERIEEEQKNNHKEYSRKLDWLCQRVITLEERLTQLNSMLSLRKEIGLPEKVSNTFCGELILKQDLIQLGKELGCTVNLDRKRDLDELTAEMLTHAVEHYDGVMTELRELINSPLLQGNLVVNTANVQPVANVTDVVETKSTGAIIADTTKSIGNASRLIKEEPTHIIEAPGVQTEEPEETNADVGAVMDMFGSLFG